MWSCVLCESETCYVSRFCDNCQTIKRILNVYGANEVKNILERVCIRNTEQRNYKISAELKKEIQNKGFGNKKEAKNC